MKIHIISASAGSGKTTRISKLLSGELAAGRVRPEAVLATTFTVKAAAELEERVRSQLLADGRPDAATRLHAARIGTVNSVCGKLVSDYALDLGLSPEVTVMDETEAAVALKRATTDIVTPARGERLSELNASFAKFDWQDSLRELVEKSRANGMSADTIRGFAPRSANSLLALFGKPKGKPEELDEALHKALERFVNGVDRQVDATKTTKEAIEKCEKALNAMRTKGRLPWNDWLSLADLAPGKKSDALAEPIRAAAEKHDTHPRLHEDLRDAVTLLFELCADALAEYDESKRAMGAMDFVDQETLALKLLENPAVVARLASSVDLLLVDEFQDTSPLQLSLFLKLAAVAKQSTWVGDPKQSIYGFRGTDPALMDAAIEYCLKGDEPEVLNKSWRSRPGLVDLTSAVFAEAFARFGMPKERVELTTASNDDDPALGAYVEHWLLDCKNLDDDAKCIAAGVAQVLADKSTRVRDRVTKKTRAVQPGDVAVLCYTNKSCMNVAEALKAHGLSAALAGPGLLESPEGKVVSAGLRLWVDDKDALAAGELARFLEYPTDASAFLTRALAKPGFGAFEDAPYVKALVTAQKETPLADALFALDAVIESLSLNDWCLRWGDSAARLANLGALRAMAARFVSHSRAHGAASTPAGLLAYFDEQVAEEADSQGVVHGPDAVAISTLHGAKGLEWPIVVLYGAPRAPAALGVHVASDAAEFDAQNPLKDRWLRYWPNPYQERQNKAPFHENVKSSAEQKHAEAEAEKQNLRLLYVAWTRARDRIVFATRSGGLSKAPFTLLKTASGLPLLSDIENEGIEWSGHACAAVVRTFGAVVPEAPEPVAGSGPVWKGVAPHPVRVISPSSAEVLASASTGAVTTLGPRFTLSGKPDMADLGQALHGFFASDDVSLDVKARRELAEGLLEGFGVKGALKTDDVLEASQRLSAWVTKTWPGARVRAELPLQMRQADGTMVVGTADLVVETNDAAYLIDHKSFPGSQDDALAAAQSYAGQLDLYATVLLAALNKPVKSRFIHFPLMGATVEVA